MVAGVAASALLWWLVFAAPDAWTPEELVIINDLWLEGLDAPPRDPTNALAGDPRAQALGHRLFFDTRLSANGAIACATCHKPELGFSDGLQVSVAIGVTRRNAPSIVGMGYSPWQYWDGRRDSLWSQALSPLEDAAEHGSNRVAIVRVVANDPGHREAYEALFGSLPEIDDAMPANAGPLMDARGQAAWLGMAEADRGAIDRAFSNIGKSLAAYEMLMVPGSSRFDRYVAALNGGDPSGLDALSAAERRGLDLFIGAGQCTQCHNGPLFTNNAFHNTGQLSRPGHLPDVGRSQGLREVLEDPFNCLSEFSDDRSACAELEFARVGPENIGAMKSPSLRNLGFGAPFAHAGQHKTLREVLEHYDEAPDAMIGHNEAKPLALWPWDIGDLEAFLLALQAPIAVEAKWLSPPVDAADEG